MKLRYSLTFLALIILFGVMVVNLTACVFGILGVDERVEMNRKYFNVFKDGRCTKGKLCESVSELNCFDEQNFFELEAGMICQKGSVE